MKQWFLRFSPRDQLALLIMAAAVGGYLLFMLALQPLHRARAQLEQTNRATAEVLARVDRTASAVVALRETQTTPARSRNLTALLNSGAEAAGLRISRLQPNSGGAVQLRLEGVSFDVLLRWLVGLEGNEGLLLEELSVSQAGGPGIVSASVRVSQPP